MKTVLVTGSNGLIGSEMVKHFHALGWSVHGVDNNMRADFFGPQGDTRWNQQRLVKEYPNFTHHELDIRNRAGALELLRKLKPQAIIHTAAQPSHDLAASRPFDDFDVNAAGTLNILESVRQACPGIAVRASLNEQGLWRCAKSNQIEGASHPLGLR